MRQYVGVHTLVCFGTRKCELLRHIIEMMHKLWKVNNAIVNPIERND